MKSKDNIISLQIKNLIYVTEDETKENLVIVYESDEISDYIKIHSFNIPLKIIENWCEE